MNVSEQNSTGKEPDPASFSNTCPDNDAGGAILGSRKKRQIRYDICKALLERRTPDGKEKRKRNRKRTRTELHGEKDLPESDHLAQRDKKVLSGKTQQELDDKIMELEVLNFSGVNICSEETFGHFSQMWFGLYKKPYLRETSLDGIRFVMNQYILPVLGNYKLRDISPMQIQALMVGLADKSYSVQSKVLIHLRSIFRVAEENGLVLRTPVSSMLKAGGKKPDEKIALTPEESWQLVSGIKNIRAKTPVLLGLHTGMRRGEMVALRWKDIDFHKGVIHVPTTPPCAGMRRRSRMS